MDNNQGAPAANAGITQAELDTAVANARTAGHAAGVQAERDRIASILALDEGKGREKQALALAMTGATVDMAKAMLAVAPQEQAASAAVSAAAAERAANQPLGLVTSQPAARSAASLNPSSIYADRAKARSSRAVVA